MTLMISGAFHTTFGTLTLTQDGCSVTGRYPHEDGRVEGELEGRTFRGRWTQSPPGKRGPVELFFDDCGNSFQGSWKFDGDDSWRDSWRGARLHLPSPESGGSPGSWNSLARGPLLAGPMIGEVGEHDARIWVQAREPAELTVHVRGPDVDYKRRKTPAWNDSLCAVIPVDGLRPGTTYEYEIHGPGGATETHRLRTAPPAGARRAKIALGSCFWDWPNESLTIFDAIAAERSDLFVMLGDNCYFDDHDVATEHTMVLAQLRHRNNPRLRRLIANTPTVAVWDDHDYGPNDVDGRFEGKPRALSAFRRVWANRSYGAPDIPGVFSRVRSGPVDLFLLDERYYRGTEGQCVLGAAQLTWLLGELMKSAAPVKLIVSPSQVLPEAPVHQRWDCFRLNGPGELEVLLTTIESSDVHGVVFVSGDLHMANLIHLPARPLDGGRRGPEYWELTTSPLANKPWNKSVKATDPTMVREVIDRTNYGLLDVDLDRGGSEVRLLLKGASGDTIWDQPIPLTDLRAR